MLFYKEDAIVPDGLKTQEFLLTPLRAAHVELDFEALMESKQMLRRWSQSNWPADDFTTSENLQDLQRHESEHLVRRAFTFTVLNPTETKCLGCVYIEPFLHLLQQASTITGQPSTISGSEAVVRFWVRQSRLADGLDRRLLKSLDAWLEDGSWTFPRVYYLSKELFGHQVSLFRDLGLQLVCKLRMPTKLDEYVVYSKAEL